MDSRTPHSIAKKAQNRKNEMVRDEQKNHPDKGTPVDICGFTINILPSIREEIEHSNFGTSTSMCFAPTRPNLRRKIESADKFFAKRRKSEGLDDETPSCSFTPTTSNLRTNLYLESILPRDQAVQTNSVSRTDIRKCSETNLARPSFRCFQDPNASVPMDQDGDCFEQNCLDISTPTGSMEGDDEFILICQRLKEAYPHYYQFLSENFEIHSTDDFSRSFRETVLMVISCDAEYLQEMDRYLREFKTRNL